MLLMEAARSCDESTAHVAKEPAIDPIKESDLDVATALEEGAEVEEVEAVADNDFVVVATYDGQWSPAASPDK
jgi:hypothetical protein